MCICVNFKTITKETSGSLDTATSVFDQFLDRHQKAMGLAKGICQMSSLLTLVENIRLEESDSIEHIGASAKEVRCKPKYFSLTFTARKNLTKV